MSKQDIGKSAGEFSAPEFREAVFSAGPGMPGPAEKNGAPRRGLDNQVLPAQKEKGRRRFTKAYKKRIVEEAAACSQSGEIGALLRREGLYSSNLSTFRRQLEAGNLDESLAAAKKQATQDRGAERQREKRAYAKLERENLQLRAIIDIQKKLCELLNLPTEEVPPLGERN